MSQNSQNSPTVVISWGTKGTRPSVIDEPKQSKWSNRGNLRLRPLSQSFLLIELSTTNLGNLRGRLLSQGFLLIELRTNETTPYAASTINGTTYPPLMLSSVVDSFAKNDEGRSVSSPKLRFWGKYFVP